MRRSPFPEQERCKHDTAHTESGEDQRIGPAAARCLDDRVDERREPDDRQRRADEVEPRYGRVLRGRDQQHAREQAEDHDRDVHEKDRAPVEVLEQEASGQRTDGGTDPRRPGPYADRLPALACGKDVGDDRQRRRHDERAANAHARAGRDQGVRVVGECGGAGAGTEDHQPELQRPAPAKAVTQAARGQQQPREHQSGNAQIFASTDAATQGEEPRAPPISSRH